MQNPVTVVSDFKAFMNSEREKLSMEVPHDKEFILLKEKHTRQFNFIMGMTTQPELLSKSSFIHYAVKVLYDYSNIIDMPIINYLSNVLENVMVKLCKYVTSPSEACFKRIVDYMRKHRIAIEQMTRDCAIAWNQKKTKQSSVEVEIIPREELNSITEDVCGICLENHKKKEIFVCSCSHSFGMKCLKSWIEICHTNHKILNCPICRQKIVKVKAYKLEEIV